MLRIPFGKEKEVVDKIGQNVVEGIKTGINQVVPSLGAAAAGGAVGAALIKSTAGVPPVQRLLLTGAGVGISTAASKLGLTIGASLANNIDFVPIPLGQGMEAIQQSKHAESNIDSIPSPEDTNFTANSIVPIGQEDVELGIPLLEILDSVLILNVLELFLIILIVLVLINKIFKNKILFILKNKYIHPLGSKKY